MAMAVARSSGVALQNYVDLLYGPLYGRYTILSFINEYLVAVPSNPQYRHLGDPVMIGTRVHRRSL